jgi:microcystin-dependent protein
MDPFMGEVRAFGFTFPPQGWALCQGQMMSIEQNTALFSLLGTNYGGNGQTTFALPNIPGLQSSDGGAALNYCMAIQGIYPSRQ